MTHLGALITPYVDGELGAARAEQVREHLVMCAQCRDAVASERSARARTQQSASEVSASSELTARLLAMSWQDAASGAGVAGRQRRVPFVLGGGAALMGIFVLTLFVLGGPREAHPGTLIAATSAPHAFAALSSGAPGAGEDQPSVATDPLAWMRSQGWVAPESLPPSVQVSAAELTTRTNDGSDSVILDVVFIGPGTSARMLQQPGRLDEDITGVVPSTMIGGHEVYRLDGWYVLTSGDHVVAVTADGDQLAEELVAALPVGDGPALLSRLWQGWNVLVAAG